MAKVFLPPIEWAGAMVLRVIDTDDILSVTVSSQYFAEVLYKNGIKVSVPIGCVESIMQAWAPEHMDAWHKVEDFNRSENESGKGL